MTFALAPETAALIREAVRRGEYATPGELLEEALRLWQAGREPDHARLRLAWNEGIASGAPAPLDIDRVKQTGRRTRAGRERGA